MSEQTLSHCLNPKSRHFFHPEHILKLIRMEGGARIVELQAALIGLDVIEALPPSPEEELLALHQVITTECGPLVRKGLLRAKRARIVANRAARRVGEGK